jgi:hypothetical protein
MTEYEQWVLTVIQQTGEIIENVVSKIPELTHHHFSAKATGQIFERVRR